jgi:hypothetical protein
MKAKIIQISGVFLLLITFLYVAFIKNAPDIDKSIWLSEITYMYICGALMVFAPHIKSKILFKS